MTEMEIYLGADSSLGGPAKFYVDETGKYLGAWASPPGNWDLYDPPEGSIEVPTGPEYADQVWSFESESWGPSRIRAAMPEDAWRAGELLVISRQLEAIEEAEAAETDADIPPDLLPGTRKQWLSYRTKVSNWKDSNADYPDATKRPLRPV